MKEGNVKQFMLRIRVGRGGKIKRVKGIKYG
jgi:hypothetical protein